MPEALAAQAPPLARYAASHQAMGTVFSIVAYGEDEALCADAGQKAFREIDRLDDTMSHYKPDSELSVINRTANDRPVSVSAELFGILKQALQYCRASDGAFDITVGPLMKLWGFFYGNGRVPSAAELAAVRERIGYEHVSLDSENLTIRFDAPGLELDLGAIGKGYAVDRASRLLADAGITRALLSSGTSSIFALGSPPNAHAWRVGLSDPLDRSRIVKWLELRDASISVSGVREQFFEHDGRMYSHLLNPRTGAPREGSLMVGVVACSAIQSDWLSTAFFVEGIPWARSYLECHSDLIATFYIPSMSGRFAAIELKSRKQSG